MRPGTVATIALLMLGYPSLAMAQGSPLRDCNIELFKHRESESVRRSTIIFFLDLVTDSNYEKMKQEFRSSWDGMYGFFKTDYDNFKERRAEYKRQIQYQLDEKYSRDFAVLTLNDKGLRAYKACLDFHRSNAIRPILFAHKAGPTEQLITFVVDLNSPVLPGSPVKLELFGVKEIASAIDAQTKVSKSGAGMHIVIAGLKGEKQFTVRRRSPKEEVLITAEFEGRTTNPPLVIGPIRKTVTKDIEIRISQEGTFLFMARRLHDGRHDFIYSIDGNSMPEPPNDLFRGSACLCASGQRTSSGLPFERAGRCVPPKNPAETRLLPKATFVPSHKAFNYQCGGQVQQPEVKEPERDHSICFQIPLSLNAPDQWSTNKTCTVSWVLEGTLVQKGEVFVNP